MECEFAKFPNPVCFPFAPGDTIWIIDKKVDGEFVPVQTTVVLVAASMRNKTITTSNGRIIDIDVDKWFFTEKSAKVCCDNCNGLLHIKKRY